MTSALYFEVSSTVFRDRQRQGCRCRAYREVFTACLDTLYCLPSAGAKFELRNLSSLNIEDPKNFVLIWMYCNYAIHFSN